MTSVRWLIHDLCHILLSLGCGYGWFQFTDKLSYFIFVYSLCQYWKCLAFLFLGQTVATKLCHWPMGFYTLTLIFVWHWPLYDIDMVLSFVMTLTLLHKHEKIAKFICKKLDRRALRMMSFLVTFILFI